VELSGWISVKHIFEEIGLISKSRDRFCEYSLFLLIFVARVCEDGNVGHWEITNKRAAGTMGDRIEALVSCRMAKQTPDRELTEWLESIPAKLRDRLASIDLIAVEQAAGGKLLTEHLQDFRQSIIAGGNTEKQANQQYNRVVRVFAECGFMYWSDVLADEVQQCIAGLKKIQVNKPKNKPGKYETTNISGKTANFYLQACKQFCGWMVRNRRAGSNPLEHLRSAKISKSETIKRRALEPDELRRLLEVTATQPKRFSMEGYQKKGNVVSFGC